MAADAAEAAQPLSFVMATESDGDADESTGDGGDGQLAAGDGVVVPVRPTTIDECASIADEMRTFLPQ